MRRTDQTWAYHIQFKQKIKYFLASSNVNIPLRGWKKQVENVSKSLENDLACTDSLLFISNKSIPLSKKIFLLKANNLLLASLWKTEISGAKLFHSSPETSFPERRPPDWKNVSALRLVATIAGQRMH